MHIYTYICIYAYIHIYKPLVSNFFTGARISESFSLVDYCFSRFVCLAYFLTSFSEHSPYYTCF